MRRVDRFSALPLWAQIEADLRARIGASEFDSQFPTESELTEAYGVSRQTVREALRRLAAAGLLDRQRGRGTALTAAALLEQPIGRFYSLAQTISAQGIAERSELILREFGQNAEAAGRLGLAAETELLHFRRVRLAGAEPLALDDCWLAGEAGRLVAERLFEQGSLYAFLVEANGPRVSGAEERIRAALPDQPTQSQLRIPRGVAVLVVERVTFAGEHAFEWRTSTVRGDRFVLSAHWSAASPTQAFGSVR